MPTGHNLSRCLTCLKEFLCGDCIETECRECQCKRIGHLWVAGVGICGRCGERGTTMNTNDNLPRCPGWGPTPRGRCGRLVHPGYRRCPWCDRPYTSALLEAALALPENESFRGLHRPADTKEPGP